MNPELKLLLMIVGGGLFCGLLIFGLPYVFTFLEDFAESQRVIREANDRIRRSGIAWRTR